MKKLVAVFAVVALLVVAVPVFAATNPFMDVPMNHWAYDAVASLAAKGILSGYPDGLYKGKQAMTRYEVASAVARALSYVDMTTASKQDVEMLKKLVVEFADELAALGVRVDALEEGFGKMNSRLGGWQMYGRVRLDVDQSSYNDGAGFDDSQGGVAVSSFRLGFQRYFGEDESIFFHGRLGGENLGWEKFYVEMPFFGESKLLVGKEGWDMDRRFTYATAGPGRYDTGAWFSDTEQAMFAISKNFSLGAFRMYIAHPTFPAAASAFNVPFGAWEVVADMGMKFHEKFGFNLGAQYLLEDDWTGVGTPAVYGRDYIKSAFTGWVGLDFDFMQGVALRGTAYFQSVSTGDLWPANTETGGTAYRIALDVGQDVLKFTSFWAEYNKLPVGFYMHKGTGNLFLYGRGDTNGFAGNNFVLGDTSVIRFGANQNWNDKWSTWLYWSRVKIDLAVAPVSDATFNDYGIGVEYAYNANTTFGLNYMKVTGSDLADDISWGRVRFTTNVTF